MICSVFLSDQVHSYPAVDETKRDELTQNNADSSDPFQEQIKRMGCGKAAFCIDREGNCICPVRGRY